MGVFMPTTIDKWMWKFRQNFNIYNIAKTIGQICPQILGLLFQVQTWGRKPGGLFYIKGHKLWEETVTQTCY